MADDLDDFFDEIDEVEAEAAQEDDTPTNKEEQPPTKKQKTTETAAAVPVRPKGLVVAAASSAAVIRKQPDDLDDLVSIQTPIISEIAPPPPPPPPQQPVPQPQSKNPKKPTKRMAAGKVWIDSSLDDWPENDFRVFCGNLDQTTTDQQLQDHFRKYASLAKAKVAQDAKGSSRGYGFVSFLQPLDCAKAIREMDQSWLGSRPIRVKRSDWKDRNLNEVLKKNKKQSKQRKRLGL